MSSLAKIFKSTWQKWDEGTGGELSFFISHWGKTKFMMAMSKKLQYHGMEKLYQQSPKAFWLFFAQYLLRDSLIYIVLPISIAKLTVS